MRMTVELEKENLDKIKNIADRVFDGRKNEALNVLIDSVSDIQIQGETFSIEEIMKLPIMDLNKINGDIKSPFRNNFRELPLKYRAPLYKFLLHVTTGKPEKNQKRYYKNFVSTFENLSLYYTLKDDPEGGGMRNLYLNIKGQVGTRDIYEYLNDINKKYKLSKEDRNSPVWISRLERFISERFLDEKVYTIYDEILDHLNIDLKYDIVQLSANELETVSKYFEKKMPIE